MRGALVSQTAEYALRAMTALAAKHGSSLAVNASDLSRETEVPIHYLQKVLRRLVAAGLLVAQKGHGGGFSLARPPGEISFGDVLTALDQAPGTDRCGFGWGRCGGDRPCPLHPAWAGLRKSFGEWAEQHTFGEFAPKPASE